MTVPLGKATLALQLLIEGTSVRSTERITGLHRDTILRLLVVAGERCEKALGRIIVKGGQTTASVALKRLVGHGPKNRFYRATREA